MLRTYRIFTNSIKMGLISYLNLNLRSVFIVYITNMLTIYAVKQPFGHTLQFRLITNGSESQMTAET